MFENMSSVWIKKKLDKKEKREVYKKIFEY